MKITTLSFFLVLNFCSIFGQVGIGTTNPAATAVLELKSTTKGFLIPRMTTIERMDISAPAVGLQVYDSTLNSNFTFNGVEWIKESNIYKDNGTIGTARTVGVTDKVNFDEDTFVIDGTNNRVGIGTNTPAATLHVNGSVKLNNISNNTTTTSLNILISDGNGNVFKINSSPQTLIDSATITWNVANGYNANVVLGGNRNLTLSNTPIGTYGTLTVKQDATGNRTLTLPLNSKIQSGNGTGSTPSLSKTINAIDLLSFYFDGSTYYWTLGQNFN